MQQRVVISIINKKCQENHLNLQEVTCYNNYYNKKYINTLQSLHQQVTRHPRCYLVCVVLSQAIKMEVLHRGLYGDTLKFVFLLHIYRRQ